MGQVRRQTIGEALLSIGALVTLVATLAAFDQRVRDQIALRWSAGSAGDQVTGAGLVARDMLAVMAEAVRDQSIEHAPLVIFVGAGTVLLLFMLRT